jgi:hypothetical protein
MSSVPGGSMPFLRIRANHKEIPTELAKQLAGILIEWGSFENRVYWDIEQLRGQWLVVQALAPFIPNGFGRRINLWKRSFHALYPQVPEYLKRVDDIALNSAYISKIRNRLIHSHWMPKESGNPDEFVLTPENFPARPEPPFIVDTNFASLLHQDILTLNNALTGFLVNRMLHLHHGLIARSPESEPDNPAHQTPPNPEKP